MVSAEQDFYCGPILQLFLKYKDIWKKNLDLIVFTQKITDLK